MNLHQFFTRRGVGFLVVLGIVGLVASFFALNAYIRQEELGGGLPQNFKEVTFTISGEQVTLVDGVAEVVTSMGGESKTTVRYFGNEVAQDVDGDSVKDMVFLVTQETGGSGTFFYAVAALKRNEGYIGSQAVLVGDRIAPQTTEKGEGRTVIVNYADRAPGEPMSTPPSVGKSLHLLLDPQTLQFGEVVQNFEGETDMSRLIQVFAPLTNQEVTSPFTVTGKAVGNWYFEASFPVELVDWDGKIIAHGVATAKGDWMTTEFVPFEAELTFNTNDISGQYSNRGTLILKKDNPSGLPEYDNAIEIPVLLK